MSTLTKPLCAVILLALSVFVLQGSIYAQEAKFQQLSGDLGLVSMDAENYSSLRESSDTYWELVTDPVDFSGTGAMQALPVGYNDLKDINNAQDFAPVLEYAIDFVTTDPVYVWARSSHLDGYDDSVWFGLDGLIEGTAPLSYLTEEQEFADQWHWISHLMNDTSDRAVLQVPETGVHVLKFICASPPIKLTRSYSRQMRIICRTKPMKWDLQKPWWRQTWDRLQASFPPSSDRLKISRTLSTL